MAQISEQPYTTVQIEVVKNRYKSALLIIGLLIGYSLLTVAVFSMLFAWIIFLRII